MNSIVEIKNRQWVKDGFYPIVKTTYSFQKFDGSWSDELHRETIHRGDIVSVIPYDPVTDSVVLIEQFRIGAYLDAERWKENKSGVILEVVSGYVDPGETIDQAAKRELLEESGLVCDKLTSLGSVLTNPGMCDERLHFYLAKIDSRNCKGVYGCENEGENIRVRVVKRSEAMQMVQSGKIEKAGAVLALYKLDSEFEKMLSL